MSTKKSTGDPVTREDGGNESGKYKVERSEERKGLWEGLLCNFEADDESGHLGRVRVVLFLSFTAYCVIGGTCFSLGTTMYGPSVPTGRAMSTDLDLLDLPGGGSKSRMSFRFGTCR